MKRSSKWVERISVFIAKDPSKAILLLILVFNLAFFFLSALVISWLSPSTLQYSGFWASVFYTVSMILDAGCIQFVVADVGHAGVAIIIFCLLVVIVGMITFSGAVIGYITNTIAAFIEHANAGMRKVKISGHTVILNWNSRAAEIVNDLLYSENPEKVVILVEDGKELVEREIADRIAYTLEKERKTLLQRCQKMGRLAALKVFHANRLRNRLTIIVKEGDPYSTKQLNDVSLDQAKAIIILCREQQTAASPTAVRESAVDRGRGSANTVKALIQVAEIASAQSSADHQRIVVEVEDDWTLSIIERIIAHKQQKGKCSIVPVPINRILGQLLSQFSVMPELNYVYSELFSNKGAFFCSRRIENGENTLDEDAFIRHFLYRSSQAVPLTVMETSEGPHEFFMSDTEKAISFRNPVQQSDYRVALNPSYWMERKNIVILWHSSKTDSILSGFDAVRNEWNLPDGAELLNILIIDDQDSLQHHNAYRDYPYVSQAVAADIYDRDRICKVISDFAEAHHNLISILILSDDQVPSQEVDAKALTTLIYIQDIIQEKMHAHPDFRAEDIDVIIEVLNPKNYDVVCSYNVDNVVISNRFISKMITQIGEKESVFDFYSDILTYDSCVPGSGEYVSKELYIKKAGEFFSELPEPTTADVLIRAVYEAGPENNPSVLLGYIRNEHELVFFSGDQRKIPVNLCAADKLILFSKH